jgi:hypothetical protein
VQRAGLRDRVERGIHDGAAHAPGDHVVLPPADVRPLDRARPELRIEVARKGVERFVIMVVGVERTRIGGRAYPRRNEYPRAASGRQRGGTCVAPYSGNALPNAGPRMHARRSLPRRPPSRPRARPA